MSITKKFSLVILSLVAVFSLALSASAVTVSTSTQGGYFATPEQLEIINSVPEVYIYNLVISICKDILSIFILVYINIFYVFFNITIIV